MFHLALTLYYKGGFAKLMPFVPFAKRKGTRTSEAKFAGDARGVSKTSFNSSRLDIKNEDALRH